MNRFCVFDWDGTLVDTQPWVTKAYVLAGVKEEDVETNWGQPWFDWVTTEQHTAKIKIYRELVEKNYIKETTLGKVILKNYPRQVRVLTGASPQSVQPLFFKIQKKHVISFLAFSQTPEDKARLLKRQMQTKWAHRFPWYLYYDDNKKHGLEAIQGTGFSLAHYDQPKGEITLYNEEGNWLWIPSSLRRELMKDYAGSSLLITNPSSSSEENV
jgi:phosphoglycolate phosphatase-like HAD superfamily hydrolase